LAVIPYKKLPGHLLRKSHGKRLKELPFQKNYVVEKQTVWTAQKFMQQNAQKSPPTKLFSGCVFLYETDATPSQGSCGPLAIIKREHFSIFMVKTF
jgi:hypothetical protein